MTDAYLLNLLRALRKGVYDNSFSHPDGYLLPDDLVLELLRALDKIEHRPAKVGDRVKVTCQGLTVVGTVVYADHLWDYAARPPELKGYLLEIESDAGQVHYWKSAQDGGTIEFL